MSEVFNADVLDAINRALSAENVVTREGEEPIYCNVNNETREIEIPGEISIFGVEHDENAVRVFFKCPKIIGDNVDIDITKSMVYIIYINAGGEKDQYIVTDVNETEDGDVTFSWLINRKPAKYQGITQFGIRVIKSKTGGEIENEWNTTVANANILNGVETEDIELSGDNIDVVNQLLDLTKQEIELKKQNSIEEIEQKGQETLETIPDDYTSLQEDVDELSADLDDLDKITTVKTVNLWNSKSIIINSELNSSGSVFYPENTSWSVYNEFIPVKESTGFSYLVKGYTNYDYETIDTTDDSGLGKVMDIFLAYYDDEYNIISKVRPTPSNILARWTITGSGVWYKSKYVAYGNIPENAKYIKIQFKTLALNYGKIDLRYMRDWSDEYIPYKINSAVNSVKELIEESEINTKQYAKEYAENVVNEGENIYPFKYANGVSTLIDDLTVLANGMYFDHFANNDRCKMVNNFSHDSTLVEVNGKLYCAYVGNKNGLGDSPSYPDAYTALAIVDTVNFGPTSEVQNVEIAKNGDTIDGKTIISGAGAPNCVAIEENTIRIFFSAKLSDNIYYLFYRDYDISTQSLGTVKHCYFTANDNNYIFSTPNLSSYIKEISNINYFISMNSQISKSNDGNYYCGVCVETSFNNSLIFKTVDLETFTFWLEPQFENSKANFEGACLCVNNYLYYALRQTYEGYDVSNGNVLVAKIDMSNKSIVDVYRFKDAVARPCWYYDEDNVYLIHQIDNRKRLEIIEINQDHLCNSKIICISSTNMVYPCCIEYNDELYFSSTGASSTQVYIRKIPAFNVYKCDDIQSKIVSALYLNNDW